MIEVRVATEGDVEGCVAVLASLPDYFTPDTHDEIRQSIPRNLAWVARDSASTSAEPIGFVLVEHRYVHAAEITFAAVRPDWRGRGVGTLLVEQALRQLAERGVRVVEAKTLDASAGYEPFVATRAFWESRGFVQIDCIDPLPGWQPGNPSAIYVAVLDRNQFMQLTVRSPGANEVVNVASSLSLRQATGDDIDGLRDLWLALHHHHRATVDVPLQPDDEVSWNVRAADYRATIAADNGFVLLFAENDRLVGYITVFVHSGGPDDTFVVGDRYGEIYTLVVDPAWRSKGVGGSLFQAAVRELERRGIVDIEVAVMATNTRAQQFYERHGFVAVESRMWRFGQR